MPLIGLIGYPLSHSFSPDYFNSKFEILGLEEWHYKALPIKDLTELPLLLDKHPELVAFNVTIPHKKSILDACDALDSSVMKIGACNLVIKGRATDGYKWKAYNTDYLGFLSTLPDELKNSSTLVLVMGTGGSSKAIQYGLSIANMPYKVVGRSSETPYTDLDLSQYQLVINCTPVGMSPIKEHGNLLPLNFDSIKAGTFYYDLVYNPSETGMMKQFKSRNCEVKNGLDMLHAQAEEAWKIIKASHG